MESCSRAWSSGRSIGWSSRDGVGSRVVGGGEEGSKKGCVESWGVERRDGCFFENGDGFGGDADDSSGGVVVHGEFRSKELRRRR